MQSLININTLAVSDPEQLKAGLYDLNNKLPAKGLFLTNKEISKLVIARDKALKDSGRIELGAGILPEIADEFSTCIFIDRKNFASVLERLIYTFFSVKTAVCDKISDSNLIRVMKDYYENKGFGSFDTFPERDAEILIRFIENENKHDKDKITGFDEFEGYFDERS